MLALALSAEGAGKLSTWVSHHFVEAASLLPPQLTQTQVPSKLESWDRSPVQKAPAPAEGQHRDLRNTRELLAARPLGVYCCMQMLSSAYLLKKGLASPPSL